MGQFGAFARVGRRAAPDAPHGPASGNQGLCDKVHTLGALEQPEITRDDARLRRGRGHRGFVVMMGRRLSRAPERPEPELPYYSLL